MDWIVWLLPVMSGGADALYRREVKLAAGVHRLTIVAFGFLFAIPCYLLWMFSGDGFHATPLFWIIVSCHVPLFALGQTMTVEAHRRTELTAAMAYLALTPAFLLLVSPIIGAGTPSLLGGVGVGVLTVGLYILNLHEGEANGDGRRMLDPFRAVLRSAGARLMIGAAFVFAVTASIDKLAIENASSSTYLLVDHALVGMILGAIALFYGKSGRAKRGEISLRGRWATFAFLGALIVLASVPHMMALRVIPVVPYVIAVKRAGMIFFGIVLGLVTLNERKNLVSRLTGTALMTLGMIIIILWGKS